MLTNDSNSNVNNNPSALNEFKDAALNLAVRHMAESSEMNESAQDKTDEASQLVKDNHKCNCKKSHNDK